MSPRTAEEPRIEAPKIEEVREQLRLILASPAFQGSRRSRQFLEYVTDRTLAGDEASVKETIIAVNVFERDPRMDAHDDTIVRVSAREVRKRLAQYYSSPEGAAAAIRIDLPPGSYAPDFRFVSRLGAMVEVEVVETALEVPQVGAGHRVGRRQMLIAVGGLGAVGAVAAAVWWGGGRERGPFETFWEPVFRSNESVLLVVANPIVYHPSGRAQRLSEGLNPPGESPTQRAISVPANQLDGSDIVPVFNQYVGVGDMVAATEAVEMLGRHQKSSRVRLASTVEFADLRGRSTVLIGAVTNRWTMEMQKSWRFQFRRQAGVRNVILDTVEGREWALPIQQDGSAQEDFILLCRVPTSYSGGMMMVTAGMRQFGTEAGGRLLTDRGQLNPVLSKLPTGWEGKNLQVILSVRVIGNAPAQPEVVAWHLW